VRLRTWFLNFVAPAARKHGGRWCHLTASTPEELHAFAARIGLQRRWCSDYTQPRSQLHYDLTPGKRAAALRAGAVYQSSQDRLRAR
jgi:hypothetical protein